MNPSHLFRDRNEIMEIGFRRSATDASKSQYSVKSLVLVRLDQFASIVIDADDSMM
jgi:hypothetical protein